MATTLNQAIAARIADLAKRLGFAGPDAIEKVLEKALDELDAITPAERRRFSEEEMRTMLAPIIEAGIRWREEHPYDDSNPPSKVWQEELYDEHGLPK